MSEGKEEQKPDLEKLSKRKHRITGFEQWGGYMESKKMKLSEQFKGRKCIEMLQDGEKTDIFKGVSIFVNGYTKPSAEELKKLMLLHGGTYHYYYSSTSTTHTIASNLPDSKQRNLGSQVVVTADWIVDSIEAGRLLSHQNYLLYTPEVKDKQHRLNFVPAERERSTAARGENVCDGSSIDLATAGHPKAIESIGRNCSGNESEDNEISSLVFHENCHAGEKHLVKNKTPCSEKGTDVCSENSSMNGNMSLPTISEAEVHEMSLQKSNNVLAESKVSDPGGTAAIKAGHPAFLSEFYNHSRLHHISTAGQDLKRYLLSLIESNSGRNFPARNKLKERVSTSENVEFGEDCPPENARVVMHLDMDCFFVSVGLRNRPELRGQPVAVTHSKGKRNGIQDGSDPIFEANYYANESKKKLGGVFCFEDDGILPAVDPPKISKYSKEFGSLSEIASCSYEARKAGIRNGMFLGEALRRCPNLKTIPYDFEGYSEVSKQLYDIVASYTLDIEAVSCDELYIECTELLNDTGTAPLQFASILRSEIEHKTRCTASAGLGSNMLLARLGNRCAKPNGQYYVQEGEVDVFMKQQKVKDLPGVGYTTAKKLEQFLVFTCGDLQSWPLSRLQKEFGPKNGSVLYDRCRGRCDKKVQVQKERKSVSAEINYGIRFEEDEDVYKFINELAAELQNRLQNINSRGKSLTLKLMVRRPEAPMKTAKFMGHGVCNSISKSVLLRSATRDASIIGKECCSLARMLKIKPQDYRGIGIQMSKLEANQKEEKNCNALESFLYHGRNTVIADSTNQEIFSPEKLKKAENSSPQEKNIIKDLFSKVTPAHKMVTTFQEKISPDQIDQSVLNALPEDIRNEVLKTYGITENSHSSEPVMTLQKSSNSANQAHSKLRGINSKKPRKQLLSTSTVHGTASVMCVFRKEIATVEVASPEKEKVTLAGAEDINDIRNLIKEWMHNTEGILDEDVEQFKTYLLDIIDDDLEKLDLILKYFYRLCSTAGEKWQEVYTKCLSCVQKKMLHSYGSMLEAKTDF